MAELSEGQTRSGLRWSLRDGKFYYVGNDGLERPWPENWARPRTSLERTPAEARRAKDIERRHDETPATVARLREAARATANRKESPRGQFVSLDRNDDLDVSPE
jgi:hypothetical protein